MKYEVRGFTAIYGIHFVVDFPKHMEINGNDHRLGQAIKKGQEDIIVFSSLFLIDLA